MVAYLKIENPGVAPSEAFTLLGASTKRDGDNGAIVGKFGTGNKQGVTVALRHNLVPVVFAGNLRMEFGTRPVTMDDGLKKSEFNMVTVKYSGKDRTGSSRTSTDDLGWVLEHGADDWKAVDLGLREFVSNALDRAVEEGEARFILSYVTSHANSENNYFQDVQIKGSREFEEVHSALKEYRKTATDFNDVVIEIVNENQVRAKTGYTRIFVPLNSEVTEFYNNIDKWFLHFSEPHLLNQTILPKKNRNFGSRQAAVIYRRGVRVREFENSDIPSLFDYNLENLKLDESRRVDDWYVQHGAAEAMARGDVNSLSRLFQSFIEGKQYWEHSFSQYGLDTGSWEDEQKKRWVEAFGRVAGESAILTTEKGGEMAERKGYKIVKVPEAFAIAGEKHGIRTPSSILSEDDKNGRTIFDATPDAITAVDFAWNLIERHNLQNGRSKPEVKTFRKVMDAESQELGFYRDGVVYINQDIAAGNVVFGWFELTQQLLVTALEEITHHVTGATDNSRDFQDFLLNLVVYLSKERAGM